MLNAAGTAPYVGSGGNGTSVEEIYDPATNSLIRFWPGASGGPCGAPVGSVCIERIPLTADGTQVAGPEVTTSVVVEAGVAVIPRGANHIPGGDIFFSTNFRRFRLDGLALEDLQAEDITEKTIPPDFRNQRIHRCYRLRRR